jgi:cytochrome c biogenesis protein CcmG, thiol:disulfide interchange protein DsbE
MTTDPHARDWPPDSDQHGASQHETTQHETTQHNASHHNAGKRDASQRGAGGRPRGGRRGGGRRGGGRRAGGQHQTARHAASRRPGAAAKLLSLPVILAAVGLAVAACLGPRVLASGQAASSFSLPELTSSSHQLALSDYAGQPVIINFFASWSPPCTAETQLLAHFYRFYHGKVQIIGVDSRDDRSSALSLMRKSLVTYPVVNDPTLTVAARYRVPGIPATYFLNARHQVVKADLGWLSWEKLEAGVRAMNGD